MVVVSKLLGRAGGFTCGLVVNMVLIGTCVETGVFWFNMMTANVFTGMVDDRAGGCVPLVH